MGRHKEVYPAKVNGRRGPTIGNQGDVHIALEIQRGDRGRPVDLCMTADEFEKLAKNVSDARTQVAIERAQREERQRTSGMQLRIWQLERREKDLQRKTEVLEAVIERVQEVVSPNRSSDVNTSQQPDLARLPSVTH